MSASRHILWRQIIPPSSAPKLFRSYATVTAAPPAQNLTEKIVQSYSVGVPPGKFVRSGDYVTIRPHHCMTHDNSWPVAQKFFSIGASRILDNRQVVMTLDHDVQNVGETNLRKYRNIQELAQKMGVDFYPAGRGIGHQIMVEEGYAWPGTLTVASDSHSNMYGGVACLGTPVVRTDAAAIWATGQTWWQIPPVARVVFTGVLPKGVTGKDVIVALCGLFNDDQVLNHAIEFSGSEETLRSLKIDDRLAISNMTTEWGALSGLFPMDTVLKSWMLQKASDHSSLRHRDSPPHPRLTEDRINELFPLSAVMAPHPEATYAKTLTLNLSTLSPHVAGPNSVKIATPLSTLEPQKIAIQKAYLVSCTNSRASDIAAAASVFRKDPAAKVAEGVEFYIAAASSMEQDAASRAGDWDALVRAGAKPLPAGCGPCIGLGTGLLKDGEVGISATNRNFRGRMGSRDAFAYLASPEVVAASAVNGYISGPGNYIAATSVPLPPVSISSLSPPPHLPPAAQTDQNQKPKTKTPILPSFPRTITGEILFLDADNINTDAIFPSKYTYLDSLPLDQLSLACMENYDPSFPTHVRPTDVLVAGYNFGCGSSREQAATAILANGVHLVAAGSFGNIFLRNAVNNSLMAVELPRLVQRLREVFGKGSALTRRTGWLLTWDVEDSVVTVEEGEGGNSWEVAVGELPPNVQEVFVRGGLEGWVKAKIEED